MPGLERKSDALCRIKKRGIDMKKSHILYDLEIPAIIFISALMLFSLQCCLDNPQGVLDDNSHYVVVGPDGQVQLSYDEGNNWSWGVSGHLREHGRITTDTNGLWMAAAQYLVNGQPYSEIYISGDGGENWASAGLDIANHFIGDIGADKYGLFFIAVGKYLYGSGTIRYSQSGGNSWMLVQSPGNWGSLKGIDTDHMGHWVTVGERSTILYSNQPQYQWNAATVNRSFEEYGSFQDVAYVGSRIVDSGPEEVWIACGGNSDTQLHIIYRSLDGGQTWNWFDHGLQIPPWHWFKAIGSDDNGTAVLVGDNGLMVKTTNHGSSWTQISLTGLTQEATDIETNGDGHWLATLSDGYIIFSNDLQTWTMIGPVASGRLSGVAYGE